MSRRNRQPSPFPKKQAATIEEIIRRYGVDPHEAEIMCERQKVYGDPIENHKGIAQAWVGLLQPWADRIARGEPLPHHVVAMLLCAMKLNRMRNIYHKDNYDDLRNYLAFAEAWQREFVANPTTSIEVPATPVEQTPPAQTQMDGPAPIQIGLARERAV